MNKLKEHIEKQINTIVEQGVKPVDVDRLGKLVDIHKDLANEEYWKLKEEGMEMKYRYGNYGNDNYGRRGRDSRGRYTAGSMSNRNYEGEEVINEMYGAYQEYSENREQYGRGNYGAKGDTLQSLEYMLTAVVEFVQMLKRDAQSQDEVRLIQQYTSKISEM